LQQSTDGSSRDSACWGARERWKQIIRSLWLISQSTYCLLSLFAFIQRFCVTTALNCANPRQQLFALIDADFSDFKGQIAQNGKLLACHCK
jgi:hypothetical protein